MNARLDHIVPISKGGKTTKNNLAWTHKTCNRMKHDLTLNDLLEMCTVILSNHVS